MYCDGSLDEGEYTVEALMLSRGQGKSRKTFSRPAGLNDTFLLLDPIFASMRVWFALFLFSDPDCSFLPSLCQPFSILSGSGTHFFCSGTQFLLLYGSGSHFFSSQTRIPICLTILHTFFNTASYLFHIYPVS